MVEIKRYLVPAQGPEVEPIKTAFVLLGKLCEELEGPKDAILLIPTKRNIQGTTLETALGEPAAKALLRGESIKLPGGGRLKLETQRTFRGTWTEDIIVGIYASKKMLDQIDSARNAPAVIVVPWIMEHVKEWQRTWNPEVIGEPEVEPEVLIENPVVEEAMKMLTDTVNLSTGLGHPSDRSAAVELFGLLHRNNEWFDSDSIRAWALRNGWDPKGADELREVAQAILDGRRIRKEPYPHWSADIIKMLREQAKTNQE